MMDRLKDTDLIATGTFREGRADRPEYMLVEDLIGPLYGPGSGLAMMVPCGYITDRYSLPSVLSGWQPTGLDHIAPALLHDWLYDAGLVPRGLADFALRIAMKEAGLSLRHRWASWAGVRAGGGGGYGKPTIANYTLVSLVKECGGLAWLMDSATERRGLAFERLNRLRETGGLEPVLNPNFEVAA